MGQVLQYLDKLLCRTTNGGQIAARRSNPYAALLIAPAIEEGDHVYAEGSGEILLSSYTLTTHSLG